MTLIAGLVCSDGVVFAADSAATDGPVKQPATKIKRLGNQPMLYGWSGDGGLVQKIEQAFDGFVVKDSIKRVRQELKVRIVPELAESCKYHAPYPARGFDEPPTAVMLFAFTCGGRPCLLEIERDGRDTLYDAAVGNFTAIGSGKPWAQAIFRPFLYTPRDLELGKIFAYRVLRDAIELASAGLAEPIRIWTLPVKGEPALVTEEGMERLRETRELWRQLEAEAVGKLLLPQPEAAAQEPPPIARDVR